MSKYIVLVKMQFGDNLDPREGYSEEFVVLKIVDSGSRSIKHFYSTKPDEWNRAFKEAYRALSPSYSSAEKFRLASQAASSRIGHVPGIISQTPKANACYSRPPFSGTKKEYAFFTDISDLNLHDVVVCDTERGLSVGYVSKISGLYASESSQAKKWIVQKIDLDSFNEKMQKAQQVQEAMNQLEERLQGIQRFQLMKELAKSDPMARDLINQIVSCDSAYRGLLTDEPQEVSEASKLSEPSSNPAKNNIVCPSDDIFPDPEDYVDTTTSSKDTRLPEFKESLKSSIPSSDEDEEEGTLF